MPKTYEDYQAHVALMWNHDVGVRQQGIALAMQDTPFAGKNIIDTNVNYMYSGYDGPTAPLATGLQTPESCALWAQDVASHLPRPFFLLQPFSINTNKLSDHWPHWHEYVRWLMHDQSKHYVTCGVGWDDSGFQKLSNVTRLVGKTPTVMHLFALADLADGVITTSNSLAHYCAANRLRTVVLAVERNSEPTEYFRKVLHGDNLSFFNKFTSYFRVCWETRTFMDIWPAVEIGTS
ncbi:MAG: hypothetical protein JSS66_04955 [Armatimonadetes bacterium]|nr:hypothetical protein [Armatimonadota bacterium]